MRKTLMTTALFLLCSATAFAQEITVASAVNVQGALEEIKGVFERKTGVHVNTVYASSGKLASDIEKNGAYDLFLSGDTEYPHMLAKEELTMGDIKIYAHGSLILLTANRSLDLSKGLSLLQDPSIKAIAIANPAIAPYGRQSMHAMHFANLYYAVEKKIIYGQDTGEVNEMILTHKADIGFTSKSSVISIGNKGYWKEVEQKAYEPMAQAIVRLKHSKNNPSAQEFYNFIFSDSAKAIFKKFGYKI